MVYLEKNNSNEVELIGGKGAFKLKYITSFLTNNTVSYKVINSKNHDNYDKEILNTEKIEIDTDKLEQFYNEHKEKYDDLSKRISSRPGFLLLFISVVTCDRLTKIIANLIYKKKHQKIVEETEEYIKKIGKFIDENIDDIAKKVRNIDEMASKGYLSYEKGENINQSCLMFKLPVPYEFILDKNKARTRLIEKILKSNNISSFDIKVLNEKEKFEEHSVICIETTDNCYLYDCNTNQFIILDDDYYTKYLIPKGRKTIEKIKNNDQKKIEKLNKDLLDTSKYEEFYNKNQSEIDAIAKKLILK